MPYITLDENLPDHPKIFALSDAAFRLHVSGIAYCSRNRTDGLIDAARVPVLVPRFRKSALTELVDHVIWVPLADAAAYSIRDFLQWNRSRAEIDEYRERQRKSGRLGAEQRWRPEHD